MLSSVVLWQEWKRLWSGDVMLQVGMLQERRCDGEEHDVVGDVKESNL